MAFFSRGELFKEILDTLEKERYCHVDAPIPEKVFNAITYDFGSVIRKEEVRLNASSRLVHQSEALRFHTDQPYVDLLAWHCIEPDPNGPTILLDAAEILRRFPQEKLRTLKKAVAIYPNPDNLSDVSPERVLRIENGYLNLYFITFRGSRGMSDEVNAVWNEFVQFVEKEGPNFAFEVTLKKNECLFLHNKSFLHARPALSPNSSRCLKRIWIRTNLIKGLREEDFVAFQNDESTPINPQPTKPGEIIHDAPSI